MAMTKSNLKRKGLDLTTAVIVNHEGKSGWELKAGAWRHTLKQRPRRSTAYWLTLHDLLSLLAHTIQDGHLFAWGGTAKCGLPLRLACSPVCVWFPTEVPLPRELQLVSN